jgi:histidine triad (HIT) family protein
MTIFEKIIAKEIPAQFVYEDEHVVAFLDINPNSKGHTLVVPKKCFVNIFDADEKVLAHMMTVAKKIAHALKETTGATGVNLVMNNGVDAGQVVFHAHLHVIPRHAVDGVFQPPAHTSYADGEADILAEQIKNAVA